MYIPPLLAALLGWPGVPSPQAPHDAPRAPAMAGGLTFRPVHAHATTHDAHQLLFHNPTRGHSLFTTQHDDFSSSSAADDSPLLTLKTTRTIIRRPRAPLRSPGRLAYSLPAALSPREEQDQWEDTEVDAPDVTDRETLRNLAKMASDAYVLPDGGEWWPLDGYNATVPFGWEKDADGLRGHVFADSTNSTVIISIKGTSVGLLGYGGPTSKNDRINDNLLFSCCCARVDFTWSTVCDCYAGGYKCEQTCVERALVEESVYTAVGSNLYNNVSFMYPHANIWLTGHSLGGSLAALIGLSFGAPSVAFEAPADRLAAARLHMPLPPAVPMDKMGVTHVYHNADPIPMGVCTGVTSSCYAAGIAIETRCHMGQSIIYDTVGKLGWAVDIRTHRINNLIDRILVEDWEPAPNASLADTSAARPWYWPIGRKGPKPGEPESKPSPSKPGRKNPNAVPRAEPEEGCIDCFKWEYGDGWKEEPPTTTTEQAWEPVRTGL